MLAEMLLIINYEKIFEKKISLVNAFYINKSKFNSKHFKKFGI